MRLTTLVAPVAIVLTVTACTIEADDWVRANPNINQSSQEDFRWEGRVPRGKTLEVKGVNGAVRAQAASGDRVEIVAVKRGRRYDPATVKIEVVEHAGGVTVCAVYPSRDPDEPNRCAPGEGGRMNTRNNDVSVEFMVRVPDGVNFVGRTVNGEIAADSLKGNVSVRTVNGSARFSTTGYGEASSVNGSIRASLGRGDWPEPLEFKTVNGSITIDLADDLNAEIDAETLNGHISSDFPITVVGTVSRRTLRGTAGAGGKRLTLSSVNGSIELRRGI